MYDGNDNFKGNSAIKYALNEYTTTYMHGREDGMLNGGKRRQIEINGMEE